MAEIETHLLEQVLMDLGFGRTFRVSHGAQRRWLRVLVELSRWRGVVRAGL